MTDLTPELVAQWLAGIQDEGKRNQALRQIRMLAVNAVPAEALEPPIRTLADYLAAEISTPPVVVEPFMAVRGGLSMLIARAGKGKTVMMLNRCLRWAAGLPWLEGWTDSEGTPLLAPPHPLKVLIVENEGAAGLFHRQIGIMAHADGYLTDEQRELAMQNVLIWGEGGYSNLKLDDEAKLNELRAGVDKWKPDLVYIEPLRSLWKGEENSSTEMNVVIDALVALATDFDCAVWAAHHAKKGNGDGDEDKMSEARGSTALEGIVTIMENFGSVKNGDYRETMWSKSRHGAPPPTVRMEWDPESWWYKWVPLSNVAEGILEMLRDNAGEPMTVKQMAEESDEKVPKLRTLANDMVKDGRLKKLPSQASSDGSSGARYMLAKSGDDGGFDI